MFKKMLKSPDKVYNSTTIENKKNKVSFNSIKFITVILSIIGGSSIVAGELKGIFVLVLSNIVGSSYFIVTKNFILALNELTNGGLYIYLIIQNFKKFDFETIFGYKWTLTS